MKHDMNGTKNKYYAFISYKHEDVKWAKWLQHKLEHYKFPTNLNGQSDLPKRIRPTFRDVTDLKPGLLAEEINNALQNSEWLIVICSPRSAKSEWVCKEAQTFIDFGRADHIIPFVIEGNPFSNDTTTECYPEALLNLTGSKELLAANINEMGRDAAAIKVVARMFNLRFDSLWQRYEREKRRKRWIWILFFILLASIGLSIGGYFVRQNKRLLETQARFVAEKVYEVAENGDANLACLLALELFTSNRSYVPEAEGALRFASKKTSMICQSENSIATVFFSPDGTKIISDKYSWDINSGVREDVIKPNYWHDEYVSTISSDGTRLVSISLYDSIGIWDSKSKRCLRKIKAHQGIVGMARFSRDGTLVTLGGDSTICYWNTKKYKCIKRIKHKSRILKLSPNGKYILSENGLMMSLQKTSNSMCIISFQSKYYISSAFSPDSKRIALGYEGVTQIWDIAKRILLKELPTTGSVVSFSHDGRYLITTSSRGFSVWETNKWNCVQSYECPSSIEDISVSPDCKYIVFKTSNNSIRLWPISNSDSLTLRKSIGTVRASNCSQNIVYTDRNWNKIYKRNILAKQASGLFTIDRLPFSNPADVSNDGKLLVYISKDSLVKVRDTSNGRIVRTFKEKRIVTGLGNDCVFFSNDGKYVYTGMDLDFIWNVDTKDVIDLRSFSCNLYNSEINSNQLIYSKESCIYIHDLKTKQPITAIKHNKDIQQIKISYDGSILVSESYTFPYSDSFYLCFWDLKKRKKIKEIVVENLRNYQISNDGKKVAVGHNNGKIEIWDTGLKKKVLDLLGHSNSILRLEFSHDGNYLLSSSRDYTLRIWNIKYGGLVETIQTSSYPGYAAFCYYDKYIIFEDDGKIVVVDFPPLKDLIDKNRKRFKNRKLTKEERYKYYLQ